MNVYVYTEKTRLNHCMVCEYYRTEPTEPPCNGCKRRKKPMKPCSEIYINDHRYVLAEGGDDE